MISVSKSGLALVLALLLSGSLLAQKATVRYLDRAGDEKEDKDVIVQQDSLSGVTGRRGAARMSWPMDKVLEIRWNSAPNSYKKGMNALMDGDFMGAERNLEEALGGSIDRYKWMPVYGNFYLAKAQAGLGRAQEALDSVAKALSAGPKSRLVPDMLELKADMHLTQGDTKNALTALKEMKKLSAGLDASYGVRADLGLARVEIRGGNPTKGLETLSALLSKVTGDEKTSNLVRMEMGNAYVQLGQFGRAEANFRGILDSKRTQDPDVLAGACNGLGDSLFEQKKYSEAAEQYSKTFAWFIDRSNLYRNVGWAMYRAGLAWELASGEEQNPEIRDRYIKYSKRLFRRVAKEFRETRGGTEAAKKLGLVKG